MSLEAGMRLGAYEIVALLGAGGMGEVYRARDTRLKREVAIKILPAAFAQDPDRLARFQREAELLATLNHPNIGAVYGLEQSAEANAIVLELIEGETLADRIARGPLPLDEALPIARQIAEALEAAHDKGVIHRDLKPANIKVTPDGKVKVLDFGLAKMLESEASGSSLSMSPTLSVHATYGGVILGTAAYMSPEQARGKPVDRRTDIWSLGCVLFEMLTGKQTFEAGDTVSDAVAAILKTDPDWKALPGDTPPHIRTLLHRCLQKDPQKRLPHIGVARIEIDEGPESTPSASANVGTDRRSVWQRSVPFAVTALVVGFLVSGIAYFSRPVAPQPIVTRFSLALPEGQQFSNPGRHLVAISPDGAEIVYVANQRLWRRLMSDASAQTIRGTEIAEGVLNPVFSPDGHSLLFFSSADRTIKRIAPGGGAPVTICKTTDGPYGISWGVDGIVFGQGAGGILRVSLNGRQPEQIIKVKNGEFAHGPQMLPDGETLLFTLARGAAPSRWDNAQIVAQSLKSEERKILVEGGTDARYLPTGHLVYARSGVVYAVAFDLSRLEVTGAAVPVVEGVRSPNATGAAHFSVGGNGSLVYIPGRSSGDWDLAVFDRMGMTQRLKLPPARYMSPRISPDGKRVAFATEDETGSTVWIYELSGTSSPRRLTFGGNNQSPVWSADGHYVAFQSDREGDSAIFWQRADGTGLAERLTKPASGFVHAPDDWAPNAEQVLVRGAQGSGTGRASTLSVLSVKDRKLVPVAPSQTQSSSQFSPDGRWVAYVSAERATSEVYVQPFPATGAKYQISQNGGRHPVWSPDGNELFYVPTGSRFVAVSIATRPTFTYGKPVDLARGEFLEFGENSRLNYDVLPDGRFIGVVPASQAESGSGSQINVVLNWFEELKQRVPTR